MVLKNKELYEINGGGKLGWHVVIQVFAFVAGFISGFVNPKSCNR